MTKKRVEIVMPVELHNSLLARLNVENITMSELIRSLLIQWDGGEITTTAPGNRPIERNTDSECRFSMTAPCPHVYQISVLADKHQMTRIELIQLLIQATLAGRINIDPLLCDCPQ